MIQKRGNKTKSNNRSRWVALYMAIDGRFSRQLRVGTHNQPGVEARKSNLISGASSLPPPGGEFSFNRRSGSETDRDSAATTCSARARQEQGMMR